MKVIIQPVGFKAKQELLEYTKEKISKLIRRCNDLVRLDVGLKLDRTSANDSKRCEIRMVIPGYDLIGSCRARSFEQAVVLSVEALERRLESRKNRRIDYRVPSFKPSTRKTK